MKKKLSNHKKPIKEGSMSNFESITQFKEQVERYILKHKDNPNAVINDLASGLFFAFSEAFSKDGRPETNGLNMLEKMINKLRVLMKTHENLIPPEQEDFEDFETADSETEMEEDENENEVQNMVDDLNDNTSMDEEEEEELNGIYESKKVLKEGLLTKYVQEWVRATYPGTSDSVKRNILLNAEKEMIKELGKELKGTPEEQYDKLDKFWKEYSNPFVRSVIKKYQDSLRHSIKIRK